MAEAQCKQLSAVDETALLKKTRNNARALIDILVDSREAGILPVIKPFSYEDSPDIEEVPEMGKNDLRKLAEGESS